MATICPTVTAENAHQFREQIERIAPFATLVHLDFMDGKFAPTKSIDLKQAWWPHTMRVDLHVMYEEPMKHVDKIIKMNPRLVVVHAEAKGGFVEFADKLHAAGIQAGVALLPGTSTKVIAPAKDHIDHVLVFSGDLGHFGGEADMSLLRKVHEVKQIDSRITIGWDGGITDANAKELVAGGVDVLNVGGYIQRAKDPKANFDRLTNLLH